MDNIVVMGKAELEEMLNNAVRRAGEAKAPETKRVLNIDEAVAYIRKCGYSISKSSVYKMTSSGSETIPFYRLGEKKLAFKIDELDEWIGSKMTRRPNRVLEHVNNSARGKMA